MRGPAPSYRGLGACLHLSYLGRSKSKHIVSSSGHDGALRSLLPSEVHRLATPYFTGGWGWVKKKGSFGEGWT